MKLSLLSVVVVVVAVTGCSAGDVSSSADATSTSDARVLDFINYPDTNENLLDVTLKLDSRAAKNIIAARNGADGIYPSSDDAPFATLSALDAVPYVGSATISKIQTYTLAHPAPTHESVEGVAFSSWQSVAVVWGVNRATPAELDGLLDARAAKSLAAGRPFTSVAQMGPMTYVGASALTALRNHSIAWWNASKAPGFVLDAATRATDAEMLKETLVEDEGFAEELITIAGDKSDAVALVTVLENEIDVLTTPLIGTTYSDSDAAEAALVAAAPVKALTKAGQWAYLESIGATPAAAMTCIASFEVSVNSHLANMLFMSESDRPFDMVAFPGEGKKAPTAASVLALVNAVTGSTSELRAEADYYVALEPDTDTVDIGAVETAFSGLKDVVYVAVFAPSGSLDEALVDVYLVGRTSCGDLVGIHAIAVET